MEGIKISIEELIKQAQVEDLTNSNYELALNLYLKAAEMGSALAAHELGIMYRVGRPSIQPDLKKSDFWLEKSLASGMEVSIATDPKWFKK